MSLAMGMSAVSLGRSIKAEGGENIVDDEAVVVDSKPVEKICQPPVEPVVMNPKPMSKVKYRECMRNHAASIGGHASDGCGEFMPAFAAGGDHLTCAACGCHRNFHRKEVQRGGSHRHLGNYSPPPPMILYNAGATLEIGGFKEVTHRHDRSGAIRDVDLREQYNDEEKSYDGRSEVPEIGDVQVGANATVVAARNKRFRTKFTSEQKEKMLEFAERSGWRMQRHDDVALSQLCAEIGIKRNVLKVWMHNNKSAHRRGDIAAPISPPAPPPPLAPMPPQTIGV